MRSAQEVAGAGHHQLEVNCSDPQPMQLPDCPFSRYSVHLSSDNHFMLLTSWGLDGKRAYGTHQVHRCDVEELDGPPHAE